MTYDPVHVRISLSNKCQVWKGGGGGSPTVFIFISIILWGYIGCFKFLFFISQARTERTERVKPSLALAWDMWISQKIFLDQLNGSWFPGRSANFYSVLSTESDRILFSLGVSTSQYSTWFAFHAAALGFDVSNNRLRFADVQGIRLPWKLSSFNFQLILLNFLMDFILKR